MTGHIKLLLKYRWTVSIKCHYLCASNSKNTNRFLRHDFPLQRPSCLFLQFTSFRLYWNSFFFKAKTTWKHSSWTVYAKCYVSCPCSPGTKRRPFRIWWCWCWLRSEESRRCNCLFPEFKGLAVHLNIMDTIYPQLQLWFPLFLLTVSHGSYTLRPVI